MISALRGLATTATAVVCLGVSAGYAQEVHQEVPVGQHLERSAIEFSPVSPFIRI